MELVDVTLTPVQRRAGAAWVLWRDLAAQQRRRGERVRVLAPGDDVMLRTDDDTVLRGWVLRNVGAGADGAYVIMFGDTLSRRVPLQVERRPEPVVQDVVVRVVPAQRNRRVNLYL
jgi:diadenosine tetraphosphatase ApaH/serine/threonine PP2A family protein phosphatase